MEEEPKKETLYRKFLKALRIIEEPRAKRRQEKGNGKDVAIPVVHEGGNLGSLGPKQSEENFCIAIAVVVEPAESRSNELTTSSTEEARSSRDKTGTEDGVKCTNVSDDIEQDDEKNVQIDGSQFGSSVADSRAAKPKSFFKLIKHRPSME